MDTSHVLVVLAVGMLATLLVQAWRGYSHEGAAVCLALGLAGAAAGLLLANLLAGVGLGPERLPPLLFPAAGGLGLALLYGLSEEEPRYRGGGGRGAGAGGRAG